MPKEKEVFTCTFLDTDTITVKNSRGTAVTFSINTQIKMAKYDRMLAYIKQEGWTNLELTTHLPVTEEEMTRTPKDASDTGIDGAMTKKDFDALGVTEDEYNRMYRFAQINLVDAFDERLTKNYDEKKNTRPR